MPIRHTELKSFEELKTKRRPIKNGQLIKHLMLMVERMAPDIVTYWNSTPDGIKDPYTVEEVINYFFEGRND